MDKPDAELTEMAGLQAVAENQPQVIETDFGWWVVVGEQWVDEHDPKLKRTLPPRPEGQVDPMVYRFRVPGYRYGAGKVLGKFTPYETVPHWRRNKDGEIERMA